LENIRKTSIRDFYSESSKMFCGLPFEEGEQLEKRGSAELRLVDGQEPPGVSLR